MRKNKIELALNNMELKAINHYCDRYRISNRSKFLREAILTEVLRRFDSDYPSLFEEQRSLFWDNYSFNFCLFF